MLLPPNLFSKKSLPKEIPKECRKIVEIVSLEKTKLKALKKAYNELSKIYWGGNLNTITRFMELYDYKIESLAKKKGFLHCNHLTYLLRFILVKSGKFFEKELIPTIVWVGHWFPHQYLKVKVSEKKIVDVDLWGKRYGVKFGDYVKSFPRSL